MWYYSNWSELKIDWVSDNRENEIRAYLKEEGEYDLEVFGDYQKGYGTEELLEQFSKKFPDATFYYERSWYEKWDYERVWVRGGIMVKSTAELVFPDPDLSKLPPIVEFKEPKVSKYIEVEWKKYVLFEE